MPSLKTILVVDDSVISRTSLAKILDEEYRVIQAENGQDALELLCTRCDEIDAVMLDLVMPIMDGYDLLKMIRSSDRYSNLPLVVITGSSGRESEVKALALGAWDFVSKPYDREIVMFRIKNAIDRSELSALKQLKYLSEYDALTGIYNKAKFFEETRKLIDGNPKELFVFLRFDVDRFQLINSFFGTAEGDKLLIYIADQLAEDANRCEKSTYGRIESDVVGLCLPYHRAQTESIAIHSKQTLTKFNPNYDIVPSIGLYIIEDPSISVEEMYNRATLAAKTCKGNYVDFYAYYNESMSLALSTEQEITNEMNMALEKHQFEIYLQPQYNIHTNMPCGAEVLVRWMHPQRGTLSPGEFIPVFERNGFITKLDYYVWERACQCIQKWKKQGDEPCPISVNISRVNIYNPNLVDTLMDLVNRYEVEPRLLHLELTESAYTDNPTTMKKVMAQLRQRGFVVMMDDFGSGYSSLALLKDIEIDILKIDMLFLSDTDIPGRGENIIASVIRMAKWLRIPVIAEGAETEEQVDFLRSVGCDYVQGYYFARPMPVAAYEELCEKLFVGKSVCVEQKRDDYRYDDLFSFNAEIKSLFSNALQAAVIYEFADDHIEMIRVNEAYYALLGYDDMLAKAPDVLSLVDKEYRSSLLHAFRVCARTQGTAECDYTRGRTVGAPLWVHAKLHYASMVGNQHIIIGELTDITLRKELDSQLQRYRDSWLDHQNEHIILIVDDGEINRRVLKKILQGKFVFWEAENGKEALEILVDHPNQVDLILLDISMPVMDGKEFLLYKKKVPELDTIPVIMITADDSQEQQASTFSLGANDYIIKPFIPEVVTRRVKNVLESSYRFQAMVREYNTMSVQVKTDMMTGLTNRVCAEEMISGRLESATGISAMVMVDVDNLKKINDIHGRDYGDRVLEAVAEKLRLHFNRDDIIARMGGDEFAVFVEHIADVTLIKEKAHQLGDSMCEIQMDGQYAGITCSIGIALSSETENTFGMLYRNSDKALYNAKCSGRNVVSVYGEESAATSIGKWINNAESVFNAINENMYACNKETYEILYINDNLCRFAGVTKEECNHKKCYEILMKKTEPCECCPLPKLSEDKVYTRLFRMPNTGRIYLMRGKNMNYSGTLVHLEIAVDVTQVEDVGSCWEEITGHEDR